MTPSSRRPGVVLRHAFKLGRLVFHLGLDRWTGHRFLLLEHEGRVTGRRHHTPLEVIRFEPESGAHFVVSAYGASAQWMRNIQVNPDVRVRVAGATWNAVATVTSESWAREELADYAKRHPDAARWLPRLVGLKVDPAGKGLAALAAELPVVQLLPTT